MREADFGIAFGIMCNPIEEQLKVKGFKLEPKYIEKFELVKKSIHVLAMNSYINDSTTTRAFQKLLKEIIKKMKPMEVDE